MGDCTYRVPIDQIPRKNGLPVLIVYQADGRTGPICNYIINREGAGPGSPICSYPSSSKDECPLLRGKQTDA